MERGEKTVESCRAKTEKVELPRIVRKRKKIPVIGRDGDMCVILFIIAFWHGLGRVEWCRWQDLNLHARYRAGDFKSPVSTIPPQRRREQMEYTGAPTYFGETRLRERRPMRFGFIGQASAAWLGMSAY